VKFAGERLFKIREEGKRLFALENTIQKSVSLLTLVVLLGLLYLVLPFSGHDFSQNVMHYALVVTLLVFLGVNYVQQTLLMNLRKKWVQLESESLHDGLTRAFNRSYFEEILEDEMTRSKRYGFPLTLCLVDIDNFKSMNDTYGHARGDELLIKFAERIQTAIRSADCLARYGGDEFCILLPHTNAVNAQKFLSRILPEIQEWLDCTFSAGVTAFRPGEDKAHFMMRADLALYQAKREGKNRIRCLIGEDDSQIVLQF